MGTNKKTGGLRIKKIRNYEKDNILLSEKEYLYTTNINSSISSGILGGRVQYYLPDYQKESLEDPKFRLFGDYFSSNSFLPGVISGNGSHIGYTTVFEKNTDGSYTKYTFTNFDNGYLDQKYENTLDVSASVYQPYNSTSHLRGKLIDKEEYTSAGNIVHKKSIQYPPVLKLLNQYAVGIYQRRDIDCSTSASDQYWNITAYKIYTDAMLPNSEEETVYDIQNNSAITTTNTFSYNNKLLSSQTTTNSNGKNIIVNYRYPFDYSVSPYTDMKQKNMLNYPIEVVQKTGTQTVGSKLTTYKQVVKNNNTMYLPAKQYSAEIASPLSSFTLFNGTTMDSHYNSVPDKGYIIDNSGVKIECLIKNHDWKMNPKMIQYRLSEESPVVSGLIDSIREFQVENYPRYMRATVKIDRSPIEAGSLSKTSAPLWSEETLFLQELVDGKASLWIYTEVWSWFFYSLDNSLPEQLVYKRYNFETDKTIGYLEAVLPIKNGSLN